MCPDLVHKAQSLCELPGGSSFSTTSPAPLHPKAATKCPPGSTTPPGLVVVALPPGGQPCTLQAPCAPGSQGHEDRPPDSPPGWTFAPATRHCRLGMGRLLLVPKPLASWVQRGLRAEGVRAGRRHHLFPGRPSLTGLLPADPPPHPDLFLKSRPHHGGSPPEVSP